MSNKNDLSKLGLEQQNYVDNNCTTDNIFKKSSPLLKISTITYFYNPNSILAIFPIYNNTEADLNITQNSNHYHYITKEFQEKINNKNLTQYFLKESIHFDIDEYIEKIESFVDNKEGSNESTIFGLNIITNKNNYKIGKTNEDKNIIKRILQIKDEFIIGLRTSYEYKFDKDLQTKIPSLSSMKIYTDKNSNRDNYYKKLKINNSKCNKFLNYFKNCFAILLLISSFIISYYYISQNLYKGLMIIPKGENSILKLDYPSKLHTDENGFVHIKAETEEDAYFTLGIAHARDRLWQMDFTRRLARGRLSEILGEKALRLDKMLRHIGINRMAIKDEEDLIKNKNQKVLLKRLNKYVNAINYYANSHYLPPEYYLLNIKFENWTIADTMAYTRFVSFSISLDHPLEIFNNLIMSHLGKDFHDLVYKVSFKNFRFSNETVMTEEELRKVNKNLIKINKNVSDNISDNINDDEIQINKTLPSNNDFKLNSDLINPHASNSWVIHGNLTHSGKPILANDPHLSNQIPSFHYIVKLYIANNNQVIVGSTIPGTPNFMVGNNKHIAWGITTDNRDISDICEEKLDNDDVNKAKFYYKGDTKFELENIEEIIKIKNSPDLKINIKMTKNGPIIEEFIKELSIIGVGYNFEKSKNKTENVNAVSLRLVQSLFENNMNHIPNIIFAKSKEELLPILENYPAPLLAFIWATIDGEIGYTPIGKIPIKENKESKFCKGYLDDSVSKDIITGYIPRNETPIMTNPEKGFIVTANNRQMPESYIHYSQSYAYFNRFYRITEMINQIVKNKKFEVSDSLRILDDVYDTNAAHNIPKLISIIERNFDGISKQKRKTSEIYLNLLKSFDFNFNKNSTAATLYSVFEFYLGKNLLMKNEEKQFGFDENEAKGMLNVFNYWNFVYDLIDKVYHNLEGNKTLLKNCKFYKPYSTCENYIVTTFEKLDEFLLKGNYLNEKGEIKVWGDVHFQYYPHAFDSNSLLRKVFSRKVSTGGNRYTVKVSKNRFHDEINGPFVSTHSANFKYICDFSDVTRPYVMIDTGNSGNIMSPFYDNLIERSENNELIKIKDHEFNDDVHLLISFPEHNTLILRNK